MIVAKQQNQTNLTVVIIPGMFNTASMGIFVMIAHRAYYGWGVNVVVADMRGHGRTGRLNPSIMSSLTVHEGKDILEIARFVKREWGTGQSIFLLGISLGGTNALSAVLEDTRQKSMNNNLIKACAMISAPIDLKGLIYRMSSMQLKTESFNIWYAFYS